MAQITTRDHFVAEGTQGKLRELLEWLQTGPNAARGYHTEWADHSGEFENNKFELKRKDVDEKSFEQQWVWMAMCIEMRLNMRVDVCRAVDRCIHMFMDLCMDMDRCIHMFMDLCMDMDWCI